MKIVFKTPTHAARAAARLPAALAKIFPIPPEFHFKNCAGFVLGHDTWDAFKHSCGPEAVLSLRDEECTPDALGKRRAFQASRLEEFVGRYGLSLDGAKFVDAWRPSAGRPQEKTEAFVNAETMRAEGRPQHCLALLKALELSGRTPSPAEVDYLIESFRSCEGRDLELVETYAAPLAIRLVNRKEGSEPEQGFKILEALVANGCRYSMVSLAKAAHHGWGREEDSQRARALAISVLARVDRGELDFLEPASYAELFTLVADLWMRGEGGPRDRVKAFELYRRAANMGNGRSALFMSWFLMPFSPGQGADEYAGVVKSNAPLALAYYHQAEQCGYNPATKQFDQVQVA